jgi:hypothetical protein
MGEHTHTHLIAFVTTERDVSGIPAWALHFEFHTHGVLPDLSRRAVVSEILASRAAH